MTAPPDSTAAGLGPAGRCDGIAGDAETLSGPPGTFAEAFVAFRDRGGDAPILTYCELETALAEARRFAVALESEVAALTDALTETTHDFVRDRYGYCHHEDSNGRFCGRPRSQPVHRTPARVRAELEGP